MEVKDVVYTGIGRAMSDMDCPDGELSVSHNIIRDNGAMRPIWLADEDKRLRLNAGERLVYIHKTADYRNVIVRERMADGSAKNDIKMYYTEYGDAIRFRVFVKYPVETEAKINVSLRTDDGSLAGTVITIPVGFSGMLDVQKSGSYEYNSSFISGMAGILYVDYSYVAVYDPNATGFMETFDEPVYTYRLAYFTEESTYRRAITGWDVGYKDVPITSVGNTIVISGNNGVEYALYKDNAYKYLGTKPPEAVMQFALRPEKVEELYTGEKFSLKDIAINPNENYSDVKEDKVEWATQTENALAAKVISRANDENLILFPCFVRYAYRLYDGSHIMHSSPILLVPSTNVTPAFLFRKTYKKEETVMFAVGCKIVYSVNFGSLDKYKDAMEDWKDVVTSIDVFMSEQINPRNTDVKITKTQLLTQSAAGSSITYCNYLDATHPGPRLFSFLAEYYYGAGDFYTLTGDNMKRDDYMRRIKETSLFYKVRSLDPSSLEVGTSDLFWNPTDKTGEGVNLSTLVLVERLEDDYQTHDTLKADYIYSYNGRINLAGLKRVMFGGYDTTSMVMSIHNAGNAINTYYVYTHIKKDGREIVVKNTCHYGLYEFVPLYMYYPDVDAYKMTIIKDQLIDGFYYSGYILDLESHPTLNGAVWFNALNKATGTVIYGVNIPKETDNTVDISNKVYTSEVNNPFYFPLSGINTVGVGEIRGVASVTKALSQGQFGQFPLYVFSTDGVWAMEVNAEGLYSSVKPISRDVCVNGRSITQTDNSVLFVSEKGVMGIDGGTVQSISDMMNGRSLDTSEIARLDDVMWKEGFGTELAAVHDFMDYAREARMAYDYTNGRIVLYNERKGMCYVFSLSSGTWATMDGRIEASVNDYPDAYIQQGVEVTNLSQRIDYDSKEKVRTLIVTRPLKLGDDGYKTVYEMVSRGAMDRRNCAVLLWGSHDGLEYVLIADATGNRLYRNGGTGYRYYRIGFVGEMNVGETVTMCSLRFRRKYNNKLR